LLPAPLSIDSGYRFIVLWQSALSDWLVYEGPISDVLGINHHQRKISHDILLGMENWKAVVGYEGLYEVSDMGNIRRIGRWTDGRANKVKGIRKPHKKANGYFRINLYRDKTLKDFAIHRLVLAAFVGPLEFGYEVNHKNGIKNDNRLENLEYLTHSGNKLHSYRVLGAQHFKGSEAPNAKLDEADVLAIRALRKRGWKIARIAMEFGINKSAICKICRFQAWKHI
jgi:hypothetical protein